MGTIDADAHVLETPETWSYLSDDEKQYLPMIVSQSFGNELINPSGLVMRDYWVVEGGVHAKDFNVGADTPQDAREMADVTRRLAHMDELGVDVQVLYPTLWLRPVAKSAAAELALCRSYNRWLADIHERGGGRLRWVVQPPLKSMASMRDELVFCKEHGAVGIMMRGLECELPLSDPYFFPLYELAGELDLAVCVHSANGSFTHHGFFLRDTTFTQFKLATVGAFHSLLMKEVPAQFPNVRWAFVEIGASWVPYALTDLRDRFERQGKPFSDSPFADNNLWVACETKDDLPYILARTGDDHMIIGTDYGHADPATEISALLRIGSDDRLETKVRQKILDDNPRRLYGLG